MNTLDLIVKRVVDGFHPLRIVLFGSVARGEQGRDSDVDLLVVMPDGVSRLDTAGDLQMAMFGVPLAVDFLVATPSDLERHRDNIGLIYHSILKEGKVLYAA